MKTFAKKGIATLLTLAFAQTAFSAPLVVTIFSTKDPSKSLGTVLISETGEGVSFTPSLKGLPQGIHGFHIHQNPSCADGGMGAGGHYDPQNTQQHRGPFKEDGHYGDLPVLLVKEDGQATWAVTAPRIKTIDSIKGRALMIHEGGDNYSDTPEKLGGGGARIGCGIIP